MGQRERELKERARGAVEAELRTVITRCYAEAHDMIDRVTHATEEERKAMFREEAEALVVRAEWYAKAADAVGKDAL